MGEEVELAGPRSAALGARVRGAQPEPSILEPGRNVWRVALAGRAAVLQDAATYYGVLRRTMLNARRSIHILGWDIDSRTPLVGERGRPDVGLPATLAAFLAALIVRRPQLSVKLLL